MTTTAILALVELFAHSGGPIDHDTISFSASHLLSPALPGGEKKGELSGLPAMTHSSRCDSYSSRTRAEKDHAVPQNQTIMKATNATESMFFAERQRPAMPDTGRRLENGRNPGIGSGTRFGEWFIFPCRPEIRRQRVQRAVEDK